MTRVLAAVLACGSALAASAAASVAQPDDALAFLRTQLQFTPGELRNLAQGRVAVHTLDTIDGREVALAGAVRVAVSPAQYIRELRDIVEFKRHEAVRQIGTFSIPPRPSDLASLTLDADHLDELRTCRVHRCEVQLSRQAIERVSRDVSWGSASAAEEANRAYRAILTDLVASYLQSGDRALMTYENDREPLAVADEFAAMLAAPPAVLREFPRLERHIATFPANRAAEAEDILYWSKENVGPKVIISVTHMAILPLSGSGPVVYAAASKQLYGSHYFDSSLGLTLLLRDTSPGSTILVYVNRSRVDALSGILGGLKRAIVRSRARSAMNDTLMRVRTRLPARVHAQ